jgi:hypothetical protein
MTFSVPERIFYDLVSTSDNILSIKGREVNNESERILMEVVVA